MGSAGKFDVYIHGHNRKFRSKIQLEKFCTENNITDIVPSTVDFNPFGSNEKPEETKLKSDQESIVLPTNETTVVDKENKPDKASESDNKELVELKHQKKY